MVKKRRIIIEIMQWSRCTLARLKKQRKLIRKDKNGSLLRHFPPGLTKTPILFDKLLLNNQTAFVIYINIKSIRYNTFFDQIGNEFYLIFHI